MTCQGVFGHILFMFGPSIWHIFWHSIWHSIWFIFGHSIWNIFWNSLWHSFWHSIWRIFLHSIWHPIWRIFWHSIWHSLSDIHTPWHSIWHYSSNLSDIHPDILWGIILACYLAFYVIYIRPLYLAFFLTYIRAFYLEFYIWRLRSKGSHCAQEVPGQIHVASFGVVVFLIWGSQSTGAFQPWKGDCSSRAQHVPETCGPQWSVVGKPLGQDLCCFWPKKQK